ncbi:hypothetical protein Xinn_01067 [Xenorhabdus innexi]|uniref:Uncharacterized protein n=1 Tax=Xenorhabdus innexi TaxID=290109 RepID=A0A2G0NRW9_9GAMM|nr:hypothetical protein Xinn_01067 [Xenorhabdus innexi]
MDLLKQDGKRFQKIIFDGNKIANDCGYCPTMIETAGASMATKRRLKRFYLLH